MTLFRKCQADISRYLANRVPAILQDGAHQHHLIEMDEHLFIILLEGETLESFPILLLVRHFGSLG